GRARTASRCGASRGSSPISTTSAFASRHPAAWTCCQARRSSSTESAPWSAGSPEEKSAPMSSRPAAPSTASVSACASTSPSEWPARPRGWSIETPPRSSGTPSSSACASTPIPTRSSGIGGESVRKLGQRVHADVGPGRILQVAPGPAAQVHREHPRSPRGLDVVVDAVTDVRDLALREAALGADAGEKLGRGLLDAPAGRGRDEIDLDALASDPLLELVALVARDADVEAPRTQLRQTGERVGIEVVAVVVDESSRRLDA